MFEINVINYMEREWEWEWKLLYTWKAQGLPSKPQNLCVMSKVYLRKMLDTHTNKLINSLKYTPRTEQKRLKKWHHTMTTCTYIAHKIWYIFAAENSHGTIWVIRFFALEFYSIAIERVHYPTYYPSIISVGYPWKNGPTTAPNEYPKMSKEWMSKMEWARGILNGTNKMEIIASKLSAHISCNLCVGALVEARTSYIVQVLMYTTNLKYSLAFRPPHSPHPPHPHPSHSHSHSRSQFKNNSNEEKYANAFCTTRHHYLPLIFRSHSVSVALHFSINLLLFFLSFLLFGEFCAFAVVVFVSRIMYYLT